MIEIKEKEKCCGCHACINICPRKAITMETDDKGFKYPIVNKSKCTNCGLCEKVCPIIRNRKEVEKELTAYACYNKDESERLNSSSGGIFILLAKEIIKMKGVVFGASFNDDFNVIHSYVETIEDLSKFMGSKYVQSNINDTYKNAKEFLDKGRYVLFTGTPCQIEGLKSYLMKDYEKLFTQDIICHGVPSPLAWNKYKEYLIKKNNNEEIKSVSFRNKDRGWSLFRTKILFETRTHSKNQTEDSFMQAFLRNTILRDSCYNCSFKKKYRVSDITLADYWGVQNVHNDLYDNKGTSLMFINSNKGKQLFDLIKDKMIYKKTDIDVAMKYNSAMTTSVSKDKNRTAFFDNLDNVEFDKLVRKYTNKPPLYKRLLSKVKRIIKKILRMS